MRPTVLGMRVEEAIDDDDVGIGVGTGCGVEAGVGVAAGVGGGTVGFGVAVGGGEAAGFAVAAGDCVTAGVAVACGPDGAAGKPPVIEPDPPPPPHAASNETRTHATNWRDCRTRTLNLVRMVVDSARKSRFLGAVAPNGERLVGSAQGRCRSS